MDSSIPNQRISGSRININDICLGLGPLGTALWQRFKHLYRSALVLYVVLSTVASTYVDDRGLLTSNNLLPTIYLGITLQNSGVTRSCI